ncbi:MAG: hypothetical protein ACI8Q9_002511, partial [Planctomycetota bacterium]
RNPLGTAPSSPNSSQSPPAVRVPESPWRKRRRSPHASPPARSAPTQRPSVKANRYVEPASTCNLTPSAKSPPARSAPTQGQASKPIATSNQPQRATSRQAQRPHPRAAPQPKARRQSQSLRRTSLHEQLHAKRNVLSARSATRLSPAQRPLLFCGAGGGFDALAFGFKTGAAHQGIGCNFAGFYARLIEGVDVVELAHKGNG